MRGVNRQPAGMVRVAAPRFPAGMREAVVWRRGVRSYDDLMRAYAERGAPLAAASTNSTASGCLDRPSPYIAHVM
ncbi:hypothetical protein SAMN05216360_101386 [Methylobacterium phyllostachyos]|uniref:Uncharacterized protein n=1 Tax=Methylobacterium phyllostachyos TaxID=582672 RepID=A0A1G9RUE5_9HYPH|nr:hypothetical protein SAMN05216360_101386 [Methylobacterium phyllostachyos]